VHSAARSAAHEGEKVEFALQAGAASPHHAGPKTSDPNVFDKFLRDYISVYHIFLPHKTQANYSRERFRCYTLKRKTLDLFFNNFSKDKSLPKPYIAWCGEAAPACKANSTFSPLCAALRAAL
jgi:lipopolysaccharide assembly outer membrane protein LptD (OstA)